jgi:hypothetical protein
MYILVSYVQLTALYYFHLHGSVKPGYLYQYFQPHFTHN